MKQIRSPTAKAQWFSETKQSQTFGGEKKLRTKLKNMDMKSFKENMLALRNEA